MAYFHLTASIHESHKRHDECGRGFSEPTIAYLVLHGIEARSSIILMTAAALLYSKVSVEKVWAEKRALQERMHVKLAHGDLTFPPPALSHDQTPHGLPRLLDCRVLVTESFSRSVCALFLADKLSPHFPSPGKGWG